MQHSQDRTEVQHDQHSRMRQVEVGDSVSVQKYSQGPKWIPGTIIQETGPLSARIELEDGTVVRKHHDQLAARPTESFNPGVALPITSPLQQEGVDPEIIVPDVNDPVQQWFGTQGQLPLSGDTQRGIETPHSDFTNGFIPSPVNSFKFFFLLFVCSLACSRTLKGGGGGGRNVESWD